MGNTFGLPADDVITLIECGNEYGVEVDGPDAVIRFFKSNAVVDHRVCDVEQLLLEAARNCAAIPRECNFVGSHSSKFTMPGHHEGSIQTVLDKLLEEHGLTPDTLLYREAERETLTPTGKPGVYRIPANARPSESVIDVYGQGYLVQAEQIGRGLAFAQSDAPNWQETVEMRALQSRGSRAGKPESNVDVAVRLGDILRERGLIYPVESVTVERVWYCTLPSGSVDVREV